MPANILSPGDYTLVHVDESIQAVTSTHLSRGTGRAAEADWSQEPT